MDDNIYHEDNYQDLKNFKIAIYSKDIALVKKVSMELRELGFLATFFQDRDKFFNFLTNQQCHVVLLDSENINDLSELESHFKFISNNLKVSLLNKTQNRISHPLYFSEILVNDDLNFNLHQSLSWSARNLLENIKHRGVLRELDLFKNDFKETVNKAELSNKQFEKLKNVSSIIKILSEKNTRGKTSFFLELSGLLEKWNDLKSYSFYELNHSNENLIPLKVQSRKYKKLPLLSLGQKCNSGIEYFAQELAYQVAFEEMGESSIALRIEGANKLPDILCFLSFTNIKEDKIHGSYDWNLFEALLSNLYRRVILQSLDEEVEAQFLPIWKMFDLLDQNSSFKNENKFFAIDLKNLNQFIISKRNLLFYWDSFFNDFLIELSQSLGAESKISTFGTHSIVLSLKTLEAREFLGKLNVFLFSFEYWRYFSDQKQIISESFYPKASLITASSNLFLEKFINSKSQKGPKLHANSFGS